MDMLNTLAAIKAGIPIGSQYSCFILVTMILTSTYILYILRPFYHICMTLFALRIICFKIIRYLQKLKIKEHFRVYGEISHNLKQNDLLVLLLSNSGEIVKFPSDI